MHLEGAEVKKILLTVTLPFIVMGTFGCSSGAYSYEEAIKRGDVVYQVDVANLDKFEQFLMNISRKKVDTIRVTGYTNEGDPIFQDLKFDGKAIQYTYDNSNDAYAGKDEAIEKAVCTEIIKKENEQAKVEYIVSGCSTGNDRVLIRVEKDRLKHD